MPSGNTWANVDPDLCRQMMSLDLNELMSHDMENLKTFQM